MLTLKIGLLPIIFLLPITLSSHAWSDYIIAILLVFFTWAGLEIRGCREPRAFLNSPAAPSNFCREPKDVLVSIKQYLGVALEDAFWAPWIKF